MAELSTKARNKLDPKTFVFPKERRYPIANLAHARNALARSSGKPEEKAVKEAVYKKFPTLEEHAAHGDFKDDCAHCQQDKAEGKMSEAQQEEQAANSLASEHDEKHGRHEDCPYCKARKDGAFCDRHADDTLTPNGPVAVGPQFGGESEEGVYGNLGAPLSPEPETDDLDEDDNESEPPPGNDDNPWTPQGDAPVHPMVGKQVRIMKRGGIGGTIAEDGGRITHENLGKVLSVDQDGNTATVDWEGHGKSRTSLINLEEAKEKPPPSRADGVIRYDLGELEKPEFLDNGWVRVDGFIARSGLLQYTTDGGKPWIEYRPPEEAFKTDCLDSFSLVPLTNTHPVEGLLDAKNTMRYQVGTVDTPRKDGDKVRARMLVTDAAAVADMKQGRRELSSGYTCDVDNTPGMIDGKRYDAVQRNVRGNHVALVDVGRAGPEVRVRMDGLGMVLQSTQGAINVIKIRIDSVEYEVSEAGAQAFKKAMDAAAKETQKQAARADGAESEVKKLRADLKTAPEKIRAELEARVAVERDARKVLGPDAKFDGLTDVQVKRLAAEKHRGVKLDDKADAYIEAAFDIAVEHADGADHLEVGLLGARSVLREGELVSTTDGAGDAALKFLTNSMNASAVKSRGATK